MSGIWMTGQPVTPDQAAAARPTLRVALELGRWTAIVDGIVWRVPTGMTELAILVRARVHAATGFWLSDRQAEELASTWFRTGVDIELALGVVRRILEPPPGELERLAEAFRQLAANTSWT